MSKGLDDATPMAKMLFIAIGGGLYWAASALSFVRWLPRYGLSSDLPFLEVLSLLVILVFVCVAWAFSRLFFRRRFQVLLVAVGMVSAAGCWALSLEEVSHIPSAQLASALLLGCHHASFVLFWGLNFASLNKDDAEKTVLLSLLVAALLYMVFVGIPVGSYSFLFVTALKGIGVVPFLVQGYDIEVVERSPRPANYGVIRSLAVSRAFFGLVVGVLYCLPSFHSIGPLSVVPATCIVAAIGIAACLGYTLKRKSFARPLLRIAPVLILGVVLLPFVGAGSEAAAVIKTAVAFVWLSWIVLSSVQLSDNKEKVGWDEARLSFMEKAIVVGAWFVGYVAMFALCSALGSEVVAGFYAYVYPVCVYLALAVSCALIASLVDSKMRQRVVERALKLSESQMEVVLDALAHDFQLTERERAVFALLAEGRPKPYICKKLFISDSTAKSHIAHIYEKMGVHSREELRLLVEGRKKQLPSEQASLVATGL